MPNKNKPEKKFKQLRTTKVLHIHTDIHQHAKNSPNNG
jgi:hypothetical protein